MLMTLSCKIKSPYIMTGLTILPNFKTSVIRLLAINSEDISNGLEKSCFSIGSFCILLVFHLIFQCSKIYTLVEGITIPSCNHEFGLLIYYQFAKQHESQAAIYQNTIASRLLVVTKFLLFGNPFIL